MSCSIGSEDLVTISSRPQAWGYQGTQRVSDYNHRISLSGGRVLAFNLLTGLAWEGRAEDEDDGVLEAIEGERGDDAPVELLRTIDRQFQEATRDDLALVLIPTYGCNLSCSYCYEGKFTTNYDGWTINDVDAVERLCLALVERERADIAKTEFIVLGGEIVREGPLEAVVELVSRLRASGASRFSAVTNGFELEQHVEELERCGITEVQVTIDGPAAVHDVRRPSRFDRTSTFERAIAGVRACLRRGIAVSLRVNIDQRNVGSLAELARAFEQEGFFSEPLFGPYVYPISSDFKGKQKFATEVELARMLAHEAEQEPLLERFYWPFHGLQLLYRLRQGKSSSPKLRYCGAVGRQYTIDAKNGIYACWFGAGEETFKLGEFSADGHRLDEERQAQWRGRGPLSMEPCTSCKWALVCGGGCTFKAISRTKEIYTPNCSDFAAIYEALGRLVYEGTGREARVSLE